MARHSRSSFLAWLGHTTRLLCLSALTCVAQMREGRRMENFNEAFGLNPDRLIPDITVTLIETNAPGCVYFPEEQPEITFQLENKTDEPLQLRGKAELIAFGARGIPGNIWVPRVVKLNDVASEQVSIDLPAKGWHNMTLRPKLPEDKGGYAIVLDLGEHGRDFVCGLARSFRPTTERIQYPHQSLDSMSPAVLERLGIQAIRKGCSYTPTQHATYEERMQQLHDELTELHARKVTVALEFGAGRHDQPMDVWCRTHLTEDGMMKGGKGDSCWMPRDDPDFEEFAYRIACKYGWPKGPITGYMLWNEPWEGLSISGWGADMLRYRSIYRHMGRAAERARKDAGVDVLVGGCDSSSNTWDKLFPDGSDEFMPYFDFCSIHYQGMSAPVLHPEWVNRKHNKGRVLIWDTESWVANTDDRVAGVVATNRAAGYDRALGIFFGNICTQLSHNRKVFDRIKTDDGEVRNERPLHAWPAAASVGAVQHFIGEREFREILFTKGLPWVYVFDGQKDNPDDGTLVVIGDIGELFNRPDQMLFRTVRSLDENRVRADIRKQLDALPADSEERAELAERLTKPFPMAGTSMTIDAPGDVFSLYDFYGNLIPTEAGKIVVPLDARGFFLRARPGQQGSFAKLVEAVRTSHITGYETVELVAHDMLAPVATKPVLRLTVSNILNRPVNGTLSVKLAGLTVEAPARLALAAHESREIDVRVTDGQARPDNSYQLGLRFDAGKDGVSVHTETMHVNFVSRRTVTIDGKLDDWQGVLPQTIVAAGEATRTLTEQAWLPFEKFDAGQSGGVATGYLAYDDGHFYFAAKIADDSPYEGTLRVETRDDSEYFYPEKCYSIDKDEYGIPVKRKEYVWPEGVRRYSYRRYPDSPCGHGQGRPMDNVQIAFNAIPLGQDGWLSHLPGRMPKFTVYRCTDYEYALNTVAPRYGGGTEVWRLMVPGMPRKHFYPRQPKHPLEGPADARMITIHEGNTRITEVAFPWSELPHVKALLDAGEPVKFSFRVNHDTRGPVMELARDRSVSKINGQAFHVDWSEHWANEIEFAWEK